MQNKAFSMEDLFAFLNAGVSAFHSTAAAAAILEAEGYRNCPESAAWHLVPGGKYYTTRNGSAILAWRMPKGPLTGWHAAATATRLPGASRRWTGPTTALPAPRWRATAVC
jgi:aspartyl aminopeptidase